MLSKEIFLNKLRYIYKELGNNTPSEKVFFEKEGVTIYDLRRFGWSNYGEFVREAGLTPNKFDNTKYSHRQLCEMFITLIKEKNKWPTRGDLDVRHYRDNDFPDSSIFYKRLGKSKVLAESILKFTGYEDRYRDVSEICTALLETITKDNPNEESITKGFVYLGKQHGTYKIGKSIDMNRRREDLTLLGSEPFELIHTIETDDIAGVERYWHDRFKSKRKRGEWFMLTSSDIRAFKLWKRIF